MTYLKNLNINNFVKNDTFVHRLHPVIKGILLMILYIIFFNIPDIAIFILFIIILIILIWKKINIKIFLYMLYLIFMIMLSYILLMLFINIDNGILFLYGVCIKAFKLIFPLFLYNVFTPIEETIYIFQVILRPIKIININDVTLVLEMCFNFIPMTIKEIDRTLLSYSLRGMDFRVSNVFVKIKIIFMSIIPIIYAQINKSKILTYSLVLRNYNSDSKRSQYITYPILRKK